MVMNLRVGHLNFRDMSLLKSKEMLTCLPSIKIPKKTKFEIEKFNGRNFSLWKLKIKAILKKNGCLAAISVRPAYFIDNKKWN